MSEHIEKVIEHIQSLTLANQAEEYVIEQLEDASAKEDYALIKALANFVLGNENGVGRRFSAQLSAKCVRWLALDAVSKFTEILEQEPIDDEIANERWGEVVDALWRFKWVLDDLAYDLNLDKAQIDEYSELMKDLYEWAEFDLAMVYKTYMLQNIKMGDIESAKKNFTLWQENLDKDGLMNDCEACEQTELVNYHHFIGDYEKAIELAEPILSGKMSCAEVPHITYYPVMDSLIRLGKWEEAKDLLPKAVEKITAELGLIHKLSQIMQIAIKLGEYDLVKTLAKQYGEQILSRGEQDLMLQFEFYMVLAKFDEESYLRAEALAKAFDERNGNHYFSQKLAELISGITVH